MLSILLQVWGQKAEIKAERCNADGIKVLRMSEPVGNVFAYEEPKADRFGNEPHIGN